MKITLFKKQNTKPKQIRIARSSAFQAHRDWMRIVWVGILLSLCLILFSLYLSYRIKHDELFTVTRVDEHTTPVIEQRLLEQTLFSFDKKAETQKTLLGTPSSLSDPSR